MLSRRTAAADIGGGVKRTQWWKHSADNIWNEIVIFLFHCRCSRYLLLPCCPMLRWALFVCKLYGSSILYALERTTCVNNIVLLSHHSDLYIGVLLLLVSFYFCCRYACTPFVSAPSNPRSVFARCAPLSLFHGAFLHFDILLYPHNDTDNCICISYLFLSLQSTVLDTFDVILWRVRL